MRVILNLLIILSSSLMFGQNLKLEGDIFDYATGEIVNNVTIEVYKGATKLDDTKTDSKGKFLFNLDIGTYKLVLFKENYKSIEYEVSLIENVNLSPIFLEDNIQVLKEVVLNVRKNNISIDNNNTTLTIDDSSFFDGINAVEAINIMPGVVVTMDNSISVLGKNRILLLVNSRETNLSISNFPAKNIEKIEINSSPSAKYDARYDVIINITLKKWIDEGFSGGVNSDLTLNKRFSQNYNTFLNYNKDKFNVSSYLAVNQHATKMIDDGYKILDEIKQKDYMENDAKRLSKYAYINLNYDVHEKDKIGLDFDYLDANSDSDIIGDNRYYSSMNLTTIDSSFVSNSVGKSDGYNYSMGGFYSMNRETYSLDASVKYFKNKSKAINDFEYNRPDIQNLALFNQGTDINSNSATITTQIDFEKTLSNQNIIETGVKFTNFQGDFNLDIDVNQIPLASTLFDFTENIYAYYTNWKKDFDKISLQTGIRLEYFNRKVITNSFNKFNSNNLDYFPSFSMDYTVSEKSYYKLSYTKRIKRPSFNQITPFEYFVTYNTKFEGNIELKDEIAHNLDFLYYLNQKYYFSFYLNYDKNSIDQTGVINNDFITVNKPINYDYYRLGFQTGSTEIITPWLTSIQRITIEKVTSNGVLLEQDFKTKSWEASFYFAGIIDLNDKGNFTVVGNYFTPQHFDIYKVKHGFKLDVRYSIKLLDNNLTASITARNILDTYFNEVSSSYHNQSSFYDKDINNRDFVFALSYVFDKGRKKNIKTGTDINKEKGRL